MWWPVRFATENELFKSSWSESSWYHIVPSDMFEHPDFDKYTPETIPINRDVYLRDEVYAKEYETSLIDLFSGGKGEPVGYVSFVAVTHVSPVSVELSWFPNLFDRYHEVSVVLPRDQIVECVGAWRWDERPSIFVKSDWYKQLHLKANAVFGFIDAIGVKDAVNKGLLENARLQALRSGMDKLAEQFSSVSFISWGDSVLLKSNWTAGHFHSGVKYTYNPETFLHLFKEIRELFQKALGLRVYGIFTQGSNEYYTDPVLHISDSKNHICLNALGASFADLFTIDEAARKAIKAKTHAPFELYLDEPYFKSLRLRFEFDKRRLSRHQYTSLLSNGSTTYVCTAYDDIASNLEPTGGQLERRF
jgi:hypothetical protein